LNNGWVYIYVKGAPEVILPQCTDVLMGNDERPKLNEINY